MASHNFEGDLSGLNNRQLEYIENVISKLGFKVEKVIFAPAGEAGDNYSANVKRITIEGDETLSMVIKIAPDNEILRAAYNTTGMFKNEHIMYTEVLPKMVALQKAADVPDNELIKFAKCYGSLDEQPNEVIMLEDLKTSGFTMKDRFTPLSDEYIRPILKTFAIFHSLSHVIKKEDPEAYEDFKNKMYHVWEEMSENPDTKIFFDQIINDAIGVLELNKHKDTVKTKLNDISALLYKISKQEENSRFSVIQQGDAWTNNLLFKNIDENTIDLIMIDYQLSQNGNPASDLLYMLLNCTDFSSRSKHFYEWIDYYYSEFDKSLSHFGMKANYVYPRDRLDTDLKRYGKVMLGVAFMVSSFLIRKTEDAAKMKEEMENVQETTENVTAKIMEAMSIGSLDDKSVVRYRNKIVGQIETCMQFGLI